MGLWAKANSITNTSHDDNNNNMGFLLVFFSKQNTTNKTNYFSSSLKRTNSNLLLSKTQSTISICILLIFSTLLFFTLFEPNTNTKPQTLNNNASKNAPRFSSLTALQRMGTLYRRGTKSMNDIVVCHVIEDTTENDFRLFLRLLHRSSITSKSDVVFVFPSPSFSSRFDSIIREENESFLSLVHLYRELNSTRWSKDLDSGFDVTRFFRTVKVEKKVETGEPLWGKKMRTNSSEDGEDERECELTRLSYGSVLSFDANELDPENSLSGFMDRVPLSLRRWACYPMLLGRVRRNFKHVMLVDVKNLLIINDPLGRVRNRSHESVFLFNANYLGKHGKRTQSQTQNLVNSAIIMGGARGVRRFSNAVLVEIVRVTMQHKKRNSVSESAILSQLVRNEFVLKNIVDLITSSELIPEASSLATMNSVGSRSFSDYLIIQRGNGNYDLNSFVKKKICSSLVDSSLYRDCFSHLEKAEK